MFQVLLVFDFISKIPEFLSLSFPFKRWERKYKHVFHLIAGDESAEQEILPAQALLISWAGCVWYRASEGREGNPLLSWNHFER